MERSAIANRLLDTLPNIDRRRLISSSEECELTAGEELWAPGARLLHAHFPIAGIVSARIPCGSHSGFQLELVGAEGMIGLPLVFGVNVATLHSYVQRSGASLRLTAAALRRELKACRALREILGRYAYVLRAQLAETAACNNFHLLEARLARWLLTTLDRANSNEFHLTHESLAKMLGVRRVSITNAASCLQERQLLQYSRGDIEVLDRVGLEEVSCRCYQSAKATYESIIGS